MTDTFSPPSETLPSASTPIAVTTDNPITEVRVIYQGELVYDADGFKSPYSGSTISDDKKSMTLQRLSAWPRAFDLHVDDPPSVPTTLWKSIYHPDLQAYGAAHPGRVHDNVAFTIEGAAWRAFADSDNDFCEIDATGLILQCNANAQWQQALSSPRQAWVLNVPALPGFDAAKETAVLSRWANTLGTECYVGVVSVLDQIYTSLSNMSKSEINAQLYTLTAYGAPRSVRWSSNTGTPSDDPTAVYGPTYSTDPSLTAIGYVRRPDLSGYALSGAWSSGFPTVESCRTIPANPTQLGTIATLFAYFTCGKTTNPGAAFTLTDVQVLQR